LFRAAGHSPRYDAGCPQCRSLERHRQFKLWFSRNPEVVRSDSRVLHFAPEPSIASFVRPRTSHYVSADITPGVADLVLNIEALDLPDRSVDVIICNQVLEHVDDSKALAEMFRVLSPGGTLLITVPLVSSWPRTYENPAVKSEADRLLHFGQADHVRYYGADIRDRITSHGFDLAESVAEEPDVSRYGLMRGAVLFIATRPAAGAAP